MDCCLWQSDPLQDEGMTMICIHCNDTGSLSKSLEGDLDCVHCDVAVERVTLETWVKQSKLTGYSLYWMLYLIGKQNVFEFLKTKKEENGPGPSSTTNPA
jgi:hypothetical protein